VTESLYRQCAHSGIRVPRLVLASATLSEEMFPDAFRYTIDMNTPYQVEVNYHNKSYETGRDEMLDDLADIIKRYHQNATIKGHFLIFVSGAREANHVIDRLDNVGNMLLLPAYSSLSSEDLDKIFNPSPTGTRKVVVATNIAETSITIEDIGMVFDTVEEKQAETSEAEGIRLDTKRISKASARQRMGRTGRTMSGHCYRMITREDFEALDDHRTPEIFRIPIYGQVLELLDVGLDPRTVLNKSGILESKLRTSIQMLSTLDMITPTLAVTDIGHFAPNFPLSVRNSAVLWHWLSNDLPAFPIIVMLALIDSYGPSYFYYPKKEKTQSMSEYNDMR
ncbi:hypothetical protein KA005_40765, partial [bacterium]|nr:hypothetical protein [bacterium]